MNPKGWLEEKDYNFIYTRVPRVCIDLVVRVNSGVILTYRTISPWKNQWHTPGGAVLFGESLDQAAQRIAKNEIGVFVKIKKLLGVMQLPKEIKGSLRFHSISLVFEVIPKSKNFKGGWQAQEIKVFKKLPKNTIKIHAEFLKEHKILK